MTHNNECRVYSRGGEGAEGARRPWACEREWSFSPGGESQDPEEEQAPWGGQCWGPGAGRGGAWRQVQGPGSLKQPHMNVLCAPLRFPLVHLDLQFIWNLYPFII